MPEFRPLNGNSGEAGVLVRGGGQTLTLMATVPLKIDDGGASGVSCAFTLSAGQSATFVLAYGDGRPASLHRYRTAEQLEHTRRYWLDLVAGMNYEGLWRDAVVRSFLVLHLMMYQRTGAIVAAPTTSLPETMGGSRNWDYRFSWLRDASFTVDILYRLGDVYGAGHFIEWLLERCQLDHRATRIVYGISPRIVAERVHAGPSQGVRGVPARSASATLPTNISNSTSTERSSSRSTRCFFFKAE